MKVLLTGGHAELCYDMSYLFSRMCGYEVIEPGQSGWIEDKRGRFFVDTPPELAHAYSSLFSTIIEFDNTHGNSQAVKSQGLHQFAISRIPEHLELLVSSADICYAFLPEVAYVLAPLIKTYYHFVGQTSLEHEVLIAYLEKFYAVPVFYSQMERDLFGRTDIPVIHFGKDPNAWFGWIGEEYSVLYMANSLERRSAACHKLVFESTRTEGAWWLAGSNNQSFGQRAVKFDYVSLRRQMTLSRAFFNLGTVPAPYTLGVIEAAMLGMPIVTPIYKHPSHCPKYGVHTIFEGACELVMTPTREHLDHFISNSNRMQDKRQLLSEKARSVALREFNVHTAADQWKDLIEHETFS